MSSSSVFVSLWALGVIAFLFWFFRQWKVGFLLWLLGIVAFVASVALQLVLVDVPGYADFVVALEPVGRDIAIVAAIVLVADMSVAIVYTIRHGKPDDWKRNVDAASRGAFFQGPGSPLLTKRSKIGTLYSAGKYVQVRSLVDGTATRGDWLVFVAVFVALTAFTLIFVGVALMLVGKLLFAAIFPLGAGYVLYLNVRTGLTLYREAKRDLASRQRAT
jgi:uncharacterized membrane protein